MEALPGCRIINGYGPTENTTFTCCHTVSAESLQHRSIPIGRPRLSGHVVLSKTSAEDAIHALQDNRPDVVLLDLNLPGMDGLTFLRLLKADPRVAALPVVAVTAYPDSFQRAQLMAAGCAAYMVKPVALRQLMDERSLPRQTARPNWARSALACRSALRPLVCAAAGARCPCGSRCRSFLCRPGRSSACSARARSGA